jgi:hypothetical protein
MGDQVLVKSQPVSDASKGITGKFQRLYEGSFVIKEVVNVYLYKLQSKSGNSKGLFHISHLKPYVTPDERVQISVSCKLSDISQNIQRQEENV